MLQVAMFVKGGIFVHVFQIEPFYIVLFYEPGPLTKCLKSRKFGQSLLKSTNCETWIDALLSIPG